MLGDFIAELNASNALRYSSGEFELMGLRGVVLPASTLMELVRQLEEAESTEEALLETGRFQGELSIETIGRQNDLSKRVFLEKAVKSGNVMGMGEMVLEDFNPDNSSFTVVISNRPESEGSDEFLKSFWKGAFQAIAGEIYGPGTEISVRGGSSNLKVVCSPE